jgi:hypothetical protein
MIRSLRSKTSDKTCPPGQVFLLAVDFLQDCGRIFCGKWGNGDVIEQSIPIWMKMMILVYQKRMPDVWNPAKYTE